ncbi:Mediator of RNA polymerase II transcription subunit 14, partial [Irineochytrium annulatum]
MLDGRAADADAKALALADLKAQVASVDDGVLLQDIVERMIRRAHADLLNLAETLPSQGDLERKEALMKYSLTTRQQLIKLLVLLRWSKVAEDVQQVQNLHAFVDGQDMCFKAAADGLYAIHAEMRNARLPKIIKKEIIPSEPLSQSEINDTVEFLNGVIRGRLFAHEVIPKPFRRNLAIEKGCVTFRVENEFEVALTLDGEDLTHPWRIIELTILVKSSSEEYEGITSLHEYQVKTVVENAASLLFVVPPGFKPEAPHLEPIRSSHMPLVKLYDYMNFFCLKLQLEILRSQVVFLSRSRWRDQLAVDFAKDPDAFLRIQYWTARSARDDSNGLNILELRIESSVIHVDAVASAAVEAVDKEVAESYTYGYHLGPSRRIVARSYTETSVTDNNGKISVVRSDIVDPSTGETLSLELDPSLDIEVLLLKAAGFQASCTTKRLRVALLGGGGSAPLSGGAPPRAGLFSEGDVVLVEPATPTDSPALEVTYRLGRTLRIAVDVRTGRILVSDASPAAATVLAVASAGFAGAGDGALVQRLRDVEASLNRNPDSILSSLAGLTFTTLIDRLESLSIVVGFRPHRTVPVSKEQLKKLHDPVPEHLIYFDFEGAGDAFVLAIAVASADFWKDSVGLRKGGGSVPVFRVWVMITRASANNPNSFDLETAAALKRSDLGIRSTSGAGDSNDWGSVDSDDLAALFAFSRKQAAYSQITSDLKYDNVPFSYVFKRREVPFAKLREGSIAAESPLIVISADTLWYRLMLSDANAAEANGLDMRVLKSKAFALSLFGSLKILVTEGEAVPDDDVVMLATSGEALAASKCGLVARLKIPAVLARTGEVDDGNVHLDSKTSELVFEFSDVRNAVKVLLARCRCYMALGLLATHLRRRQSWVDGKGLQINWDLKSLSILCLENPGGGVGCHQLRIGWEDAVSNVAGVGTSPYRGGAPAVGRRLTVKYIVEWKVMSERATKFLDALSRHLGAFVGMHADGLFSRLQPLVYHLIDIELQRNFPPVTLPYAELAADGTPVPSVDDRHVDLIALSASSVRLEVGHYAADFTLLPDGAISLFDAADTITPPIPWSPPPKPENPNNTLSAAVMAAATEAWNNAMEPWRRRIPYFSDMTETRVNYASLVSQIASPIDQPDCPGASVLPLPHGVIFSAHVLAGAIARTEAHLNKLDSLHFVNGLVKKLQGNRIRGPAMFEPENLRIMYQTDSQVVAGFTGGTDQPLKVRMALKDQEQVAGQPTRNAAFKEDLQNLCTKVHGALQMAPDARLYLKRVFDLTALPMDVLKDLILVCKLEKKTNPVTFLVEWDLLSTIIDMNFTRISLVIHVKPKAEPDAPATPVRLITSYTNGAVAVVREDGAPSEDDFTAVAVLTPEARARLQVSAMGVGLSKAVATASLNAIAPDKGGPGKLFAMTKYLCTKGPT